MKVAYAFVAIFLITLGIYYASSLVQNKALEDPMILEDVASDDPTTDHTTNTEETETSTPDNNVPTPFPTEDIEEVRYPRTNSMDFHAGIALMLYRSDYEDLKDLRMKSKTILDRLVGLNVNAISINTPFVQDGVYASEVRMDPEITPKIEDIEILVEEAKKRKFSIMLRPILDEARSLPPNTAEWRGTIRPSNPDEWFDSYGNMMREYAQFAETEGVDVIVIGVELTSLEKHTSHWKKLISEVRKIFSGQITYSSNRGISREIPWDDLDFIGIDAFFDLSGIDNPSTKDLENSWSDWVVPITKRAQQVGKPFVLTEIGVSSQENSWQRSWVWNHKTPIDMSSQRIYYAASCTAWKPHTKGMYWWSVNVWLPKAPLEDPGFNPMGKPAEREIKNCFQSP